MIGMKWDESLSVKITSIDNQHKVLITMINNLQNALISGEASSVLNGVLKKLADYIDSHFRFEERLFSQHGYPDQTAHIQKHHEFEAEVKRIAEGFAQGTNFMASADLMTLLTQWLVKHIKGTDQSYSQFMIAKGVK